jgi:hypothetical protein
MAGSPWLRLVGNSPSCHRSMCVATDRIVDRSESKSDSHVDAGVTSATVPDEVSDRYQPSLRTTSPVSMFSNSVLWDSEQ